ncbi:MAG: LysR family transcriptional regulator [Dehalococcoidia bacterium]|nr:LysR family transcriptional regulator [Dehalococcoidia bacterium]
MTNPTDRAANFHLQQLAYLREVERAGTLTEAARRLHVSQPALSQSLTELERRLGVPLFEREGRRRVFTEAGREVATFAAEVLGRAAELEERLLALREGEAGTLRVGMIDAASLYVLPETIRLFREEHPAVRLQLVVDTSEELLARLRAFDLDLAVVVGPVEGSEQVSEVSRESLYVYGPPQGAAPDAWVLYPADSHTRALIDEGLARAGLTAEVTLESSNPEILRQMVALGLGRTVLPEAVAERGSPPLRRLREAAVAERSLLGVRRAGAPPDPRAEAFLRLAAG